MSKLQFGKSLFVWLVLAVITGTGAIAGEFEIGLQGGVVQTDSDMALDGDDDIEPLFGPRLGYQFADRWGWFADGWLGEMNTVAGEAETLAGRTGIEYFFGSNANWFVDLGFGQVKWSDLNVGDGDVDRPFGSLSFGQRFAFGENASWRWELRGDHNLDDDGLTGDEYTLAQGLVSLMWGGSGGGGKVDSDGDGVYDRKDRCPGTPQGATVDEKGCPTDSDNDGVYDGIDMCADTPEGWPVDGRGCPTDGDGDGVADGEDACPDTPSGATVDARGCPQDSDGDGVYDGLDRCPGTPAGTAVDARGCKKDTDGDGVDDGRDRCANTPRGAAVDANGCPKDTDGDGVYDGLDRCPDTPRGTTVDEKGCPKAAPLFEEKKRSLVLEGVNFEVDSADLLFESKRVLDRVAASLMAWPEVRVEIGGHTDSSGRASYNKTLSQKRADSVRDYLVSKGVASSRLVSAGYGEETPIADNTTKEGKATNRRVELKKLN